MVFATSKPNKNLCVACVCVRRSDRSARRAERRATVARLVYKRYNADTTSRALRFGTRRGRLARRRRRRRRRGSRAFLHLDRIHPTAAAPGRPDRNLVCAADAAAGARAARTPVPLHSLAAAPAQPDPRAPAPAARVPPLPDRRRPRHQVAVRAAAAGCPIGDQQRSPPFVLRASSFVPRVGNACARRRRPRVQAECTRAH